ncbi:AzlD domain-containing protein [Streptomyces sp. NPDC058685]|uniref:AzlD domain-containing protein n=1 Tax=Streptomyces sp. NPDC058685 TaxID=3346598 RepID=UPI003650D121
MTMTTLWIAIAATALVSFAFKAVGPVVLGGRELPDRARSVIALLAPALLAGFVLVETVGPGWRDLDLTLLAGLGVALGLRLLRVPLVVSLFAAVAVTALLRLWV